MSRDLPEFPNIDHLRKQAKAALRELQKHDPDAKLADAQHAVARQYGFPSWPKLKIHVESSTRSTPTAKPEGAGSGSVGGSGTTSGTIPPASSGGQFRRYREAAQRAIFFARFSAGKRDTQSIETEDLLVGLIEADKDLMHRLIGELSTNDIILRIIPTWAESIRRELDRRKANPESFPTVHRPLSIECKQILQHAAEEADRLGHEHIGTGHFLLGFFREEASSATSILIDILANKGMRLETIRAEIKSLLEDAA